MIHDERLLYLRYAETLKYPSALKHAVTGFFQEDAIINIVHPLNQLKGSKAYLEHFLLPLQNSSSGGLFPNGEKPSGKDSGYLSPM